MGISQSSDPRKPVSGGIYIQTEKTGYISGETISGVLHVNLEENFQGHILLITLEGLEETHYTYTIHSGHANKDHRNKRVVGLNKFLDYSIPVYDFALGTNQLGFTMLPGQWSIPFSLVTASSLPSSMKYMRSVVTYCELKYRIYASIISTDTSVRPIQGIQEIFIAQRDNLVNVNLSKSYQFEMNTVCCCSRQKLLMNASIEKACYLPGESVKVTLGCDMRGDVKNKAKSISLEFFGILTMKSNNSVHTRTLTVFNQENSIKLKGDTIQEIVEIVIPQDISMTSQGNLINLTYNLRIKPSFSGCCSCQTDSNSDNFIFPIKINPTSSNMGSIHLPQFSEVVQPQGWNPTQLQQAQFSAQQAAFIQQQKAKFPSNIDTEANQNNPFLETEQKLDTYYS